jgi:nucleoside 2-deoxyribosyltransferase
MKIFLSGIITGSHVGRQLHDQGYRQELKQLLQKNLPQAEVICPWDMNPDALEYGPEKARQTFLAEVEAATSADLVVAYIPQASMGTAIEMWEASKTGVPILAITPLGANWVVMLLASQVFPTMDEFARFVENGGLAAYAR